MKRVVVFLMGLLALVACDKGENWWGKGPHPEYGVFSFNEKVTVVAIDGNTKSFRLEGRYLKNPDETYAGYVGLFVNRDESTAIPGKHFRYDETARFSVDESGNVCLDVKIFPENITEELKIVYYVPLNTDFNDTGTWPNRIGETTILLRPAAR